MRIVVVMIVMMVVVAARFRRRGVVGADDDDPAPKVQHVDFGPVEIAEPGAGQHLVRGADRPAAADEVEDPIDVREDGIDLVRDEHDRGAGVAAKSS